MDAGSFCKVFAVCGGDAKLKRTKMTQEVGCGFSKGSLMDRGKHNGEGFERADRRASSNPKTLS
jgi:hypothetical protein